MIIIFCFYAFVLHWFFGYNNVNFLLTVYINIHHLDLKKIRPCFVPDPKFKYALARYKEKEEISGIIILLLYKIK